MIPAATLTQTNEGRNRWSMTRWTELWKLAAPTADGCRWATCTRDRDGNVNGVEFHARRPRI